MSLEIETIKTLTQSVCEMMIHASYAEDAPLDGGKEYSAFTRISGVWNGVVAIDCPGSLARHVASSLFSAPANKLTADDLRDGILEMANVIGGNIKALLPPPCRLSLPSQSESDLLRHYRHMQMVMRADIPVDRHRFTLTILKDAA